jgi:hypothetical protein
MFGILAMLWLNLHEKILKQEIDVEVIGELILIVIFF